LKMVGGAAARLALVFALAPPRQLTEGIMMRGGLRAAACPGRIVSGLEPLP